MSSMMLTAKRQATLPRELCDELGVKPGDRLDVDRAIVDGKPVWILSPHHVDWSWIGSAQVPPDISHDMDAVRASIGRGLAQERS
jgi:bifunctional DNA-binding transcriptional regulator/antitoxin component of YhaV-PrlF toxin-antitoxin module